MRASLAFVGTLAVLAVCLVGTGIGRVSDFPSLPQPLLLLGAPRVHVWRTRGEGEEDCFFDLDFFCTLAVGACEPGECL